MKAVLLATCLGVGCIASAHAANIATFAQTSNSNTVTATDNGTSTTISVQDATLAVGQFLGILPPGNVFFDLTATSTDAAVPIGPAVLQHYSGSFCLTTAINCGGTNVLSGSFTDAAFGTGQQLSVNVGAPPDTLNLTSSIISANELANPSALTLAFTNVTPAVHIDGSTIAAFNASFSGTVSASAVPAPEPISMAMLGSGLLGLAAVKRRRN